MRQPYALFILILLIGIFGSSLYIAESANIIRKLNQEVWSSHRDYDNQLDDYSRLRLEYGALTSLPRIEQIADSELGMIFPEKIHQIDSR